MSKIVLYFIPLLYIQLLLLFFILLSFDLILFYMHIVVFSAFDLHHCVTCTIRLHYFNNIYSRTSLIYFDVLSTLYVALLEYWDYAVVIVLMTIHSFNLQLSLV